MNVELNTDVKAALVGAATFVVAKWLLTRNPRPREKLPVFPRKPWPVVGNGLWLCNNHYLHLMLTDWARQHGEMYSLKIGRYNAVMLNSQRVLRDLLVKRGDVTSERTTFLPIFKILRADYGIINSCQWKVQRRSSLEGLREFGLGKKSLEEKIMEEADIMTQTLGQLVGQDGETPINPSVHFVNAAVNIICSVIFGNRYSYEDPDFMHLMSTLRLLFSQGGLKEVSVFIPEFLILIPVLFPFVVHLIYRMTRMQRHTQRIIEEHRSSLDENSPRDFIDHYLLLVRQNDGVHTDREMLMVIFDLFIAGSETSSMTLRWLVLYLIHYPDVQQRCFSEIQQFSAAPSD